LHAKYWKAQGPLRKNSQDSDYSELDGGLICEKGRGSLAKSHCESSRPLGDVLVINDNCLWANGSWRNKNAGLDHIEQEFLEIHKHWLWIK
jgi:hypothetical protein